jgi:hypothetical protein
MARGEFVAICTGNFLGLSYEISNLAAYNVLLRSQKPLGETKTTGQVLHFHYHSITTTTRALPEARLLLPELDLGRAPENTGGGR